MGRGRHFSSKVRRKRSKTRLRFFRTATIPLKTGAELEKDIIPIFFFSLLLLFLPVFLFNLNSDFSVYIVIIVHEDIQIQKQTPRNAHVVTRTNVCIDVYLRMLCTYKKCTRFRRGNVCFGDLAPRRLRPSNIEKNSLTAIHLAEDLIEIHTSPG